MSYQDTYVRHEIGVENGECGRGRRAAPRATPMVQTADTGEARMKHEGGSRERGRQLVPGVGDSMIDPEPTDAASSAGTALMVRQT